MFRFPVVRAALTSSAVMAAGDVICQSIQYHKCAAKGPKRSAVVERPIYGTLVELCGAHHPCPASNHPC